MRTCFYITSDRVPNTYTTISNFIKNANGKRNYHGCFYINADGTRKLIDEKDNCWYKTEDPFWKLAKHADFKIMTRSQKNKQPKAKIKDVVKYLSNVRSFIEK